jgi:hypothetical protein
MLRFILLLVVVTGCAEQRGLHDLPNAPLRPVVTQPFLENTGVDVQGDWTALVHQAAEAWNNGLVEAGCDPVFHVVAVDSTEPAYPVTLYTRDEWPWGPNYIGMLTNGPLGDGHIDIHTRGPFAINVTTLVHEFGHALGLGHYEGDTAMSGDKVNDELFAPTASDIERLCP